MKNKKTNVIMGLLLLGIVLTACANGAAVVGVEQSGEGAVGPQEIKGATQIIKFDPASMPLDGEPIPGECVGSSIVPGTYHCDLGGGDTAEPCFALGGTRLLCGPDPVNDTYSHLVSPTNTLPSIAPPSPDQAVHFFVELDTGLTCTIRTGPEPVIIGGIAAQYECDEPYTYIMGFEKSAPVWEAGVYTLDPDTGGSASGKVPVDVVRTWIP